MFANNHEQLLTIMVPLPMVWCVQFAVTDMESFLVGMTSIIRWWALTSANAKCLLQG